MAQSNGVNGSRGEALEMLLSELSEAVQDLRENNAHPDADLVYRQKALEVANSVVDALKKPNDHWHYDYVALVRASAIQVFNRLGAFDAIPTDRSISYAELAQRLDAEAALIRRIAWVLVAAGILTQEGTDRVAHTPRSMVFLDGPFSASIVTQIIFDDQLNTFRTLPAYFAKYGRKEPVSRTHTPMAFAAGTPELTVWETMARDRDDPRKLAKFMTVMGMMNNSMPMVGIYDYGWVAQKAAKSATGTAADRPLFVDVGASKGHVTKAILESTPGLPAGRCVLQDLPQVIEELKSIDDPTLREAKKMAIDFHEEQPVKGALIYFIRRCLHDYGDAECVKILGPLVEAMADDSRILIMEEIMTNPPSFHIAVGDFTMMAYGGKERTLEDFINLTSKVGLKILKVHQKEGMPLSVIECVKET